MLVLNCQMKSSVEKRKWIRKAPERTRVEINAGPKPMLVVFEPLAQEFSLDAWGKIYLDLPLGDLKDLGLTAWDTGVSIWLPNTSGHFVRDADGNVICEL